MQVIHAQSVIRTLLGTLDGDGNIASKIPLSVEISVLKSETFIEVLNALIKARQDVIEKNPDAFVVHVRTVVETVFGILGDDNNVALQQPVTREIPTLKPEDFSQVAEALLKIKADTEAQQIST